MSFAMQVLLRKGKPYTMNHITGHFYFAKIGHYHIAVTDNQFGGLISGTGYSITSFDKLSE
jgi:hypothetical protein